MKKDEAKKIYEEGCELYLQLFLQKHGYLMTEGPWWWTYQKPGSALVINGKYIIHMIDIRHDIDNDISEEKLKPWLEYNAQLKEMNLVPSFYEQWLNNTLTYSIHDIEYISRLKNKVEAAQLELDKELYRLRNR